MSDIYFTETIKIDKTKPQRPLPDVRRQKDSPVYFEDKDGNVICDYLERYEFVTVNPFSKETKTCIHHIPKREVYIRKENRKVF